MIRSELGQVGMKLLGSFHTQFCIQLYPKRGLISLSIDVQGIMDLGGGFGIQ